MKRCANPDRDFVLEEREAINASCRPEKVRHHLPNFAYTCIICEIEDGAHTRVTCTKCRRSSATRAPLPLKANNALCRIRSAF